MRKNLNKLGAVLMTSMLVATMSFSAFAVDGTTEAAASSGVKSIAKKVTTDEGNHTMAPKTTFELEVTAGPTDKTVDLKGSDDATHTYVLTQGTADQISGMTLTGANFSDITTYSAEYTKNFGISVPDSIYSIPGVYSYTVKEKNGGYKGITYDTNTYYMYVSVINDGNGGVKVDSIVLATEEGTKIADITNDYGKNNDTTHDLTITKAITGNAGELTKNFTFVITVTPDEANEQFEVYDETGGTSTLLETLGGDDYTVTYSNMTNASKLHIYGLTEGDKITVQESEAGANGYTTTYNITSTGNINTTLSGTLESANDLATVYADADNAVITVTNHRDNVTPTGVAMDVAPYALMLALAGGAAVTFFRKRENFED